jgi:hypothetical protein
MYPRENKTNDNQNQNQNRGAPGIGWKSLNDIPDDLKKLCLSKVIVGRESATGVEEKKDEHVLIVFQDSANYSDEILNAVQFSLEEDPYADFLHSGWWMPSY